MNEVYGYLSAIHEKWPRKTLLRNKSNFVTWRVRMSLISFDF